MRKALESFYAGACEEGKNLGMQTADPEKSWEICERLDWMLWLLRRQCSVKDVPDPARSIVRLFFQFTEEAYDEMLEPKRTEIMEKYADALRAIMPNPFTSEGYEWLRSTTLAKHHRRGTYYEPAPPAVRPPSDGKEGVWKRIVRWFKGE